ncbi:MAG TPA: hypothetical protein VFT13_12145 [Candidatus Krumholzibacteria bacterium]|nr:hypothetical protein [Candidatus Krumholzibacteria bacterium]
MKIAAVSILAGLVTMGYGSARAQDWYGAATWQISVPTGDTRDFVDETSFRGFGLDFRKVLATSTTLGIVTGWNVLHERRTGTTEINNVSVTGTQDRTINSFPIMVGLHRYFGERRQPRPYVGLNAGAFVIIRTFEIGVYSAEEDAWDWGIAPEAGIVIPTQSGAGVIINARYNWSFTSQDLSGADEDLTYWGINVGFVWEQY